MKTLRPKILFKKNHKFPKIRQSCYVSGKNQRNSEPARKKLFGSSQTKISFFLIQQPPSAPPSLPHRPKNFACRENIKSPTKPLSGKKFHEHEYAYTDTLGTTNPRTGKGGLGRERGRERGGFWYTKEDLVGVGEEKGGGLCCISRFAFTDWWENF